MSRLSQTVGNYYGMSPIKAEVGVEVEVESNHSLPPQDEVPGWRKLHDGSLRGEYNAEYIFDGPSGEANSIKRVTKLYQVMERYGRVSPTVRAGVHIHINVRDMTLLQLFTFITCYYIVEEVLTDTCGIGRQGNHFCLRAMDSELALVRLVEIVRENYLARSEAEVIRYSALNLNALHKFGSLEFRQLRTPTTPEPIIDWMVTLLAIKRNSSLFENPEAVVNGFSYGGERSFFNSLLGGAPHHVNYTNETDDKLRNGVRLVQDLAYARDWNSND